MVVQYVQPGGVYYGALADNPLPVSELDIAVDGVLDFAWSLSCEPPNIPARVGAIVNHTLVNYYAVMGVEW